MTPWPHRHYCASDVCAVCVADVTALRDASRRQLALAAGVPDLADTAAAA